MVQAQVPHGGDLMIKIGRGKYYVVETKEVTGPSSYATGGFEVITDNLSKVHDAIVVMEDGDNLYKAGYEVLDRGVKIQVYEVSYDSSNTTLKVAEVASGTDLSALRFKVLLIGE